MLTQTESRTSNLTDLITGDSEAKITDFLRSSLLANFYLQNCNKKLNKTVSVNRNTFFVFSLIHYSCSIYVVLSREWSRVLICNCTGAAWPTLQITVSVIGDLLNYTSHRFYWFWNNKNYQITLLVKYWKLYICCPNTITFESYHTHSNQWSHDR